MADFLQVFSGGDILDGWQDVSISRAFDRLAGSFSLSLAETSPDDPTARKLLRGKTVNFYVNGVPVLSGIVRKRTRRYTSNSSDLSVSGRDVLVDAVDCSAIAIPGQWFGASIETVCSELLRPFPTLRFNAALSVGELRSVSEFALETGETVFDALDRLARLRGLLLASDLSGGLYFTRAGRNRAPVVLEYGTNIEAGTLVEDDSERFSRYIFNAQAPSAAHWDTGIAPGPSVRAEAIDAGVDRSRPLVFTAEAAADEIELYNRALFEATTRAARAVRVEYTLPGWTLDGYLWTPGDLVSVFDPMLGVGTSAGSPVDLFIAGVEFSRASGSSGSSVKLELYRPGAFSVLPPKKAKTPGLELWDALL